MNKESLTNKKAWEYKAYEAWIKRDGLPSDKGKEIMINPLNCLKNHEKYFRDIEKKKIANICGSNGRKAVPLALLGADVTVFDISEENKKYALELAKSVNAKISYIVCDIYDIDLNIYGNCFDILYLEGGILHYFHDIDKLMNILFSLLNKNGKIVLSDFHPFRKIYPINSFKSSIEDYFDTKIHNSDLAYKHLLNTSENEEIPSCKIRLYNLSEIINSLIKAGFIIKEFNETPSWTNEKIPGEFTIYAIKD